MTQKRAKRPLGLVICDVARWYDDLVVVVSSKGDSGTRGDAGSDAFSTACRVALPPDNTQRASSTQRRSTHALR